MTQAKRLISIVTPCYNEELNVFSHYDAVCKAVAGLRNKYDFEFIYTDNCSKDRTFELLTDLSRREKNVRAMRFARNIGSTRAMMMGLSKAKGDAVMLIQADLQDPPELIPEFVREWEAGYDVVYGEIQKRVQENALLQLGRRLYYTVVDRLSEVPTPRNAGDFRLTSRRALDALLQYQEYEIYLRGAIAHVGFPQKPLPYIRRPRVAGESQAPLYYLFSFALNGIISTSVAPLRAVTIAGVCTSLIGFSMMFYFLAFRIFFPEQVPPGVSIIAILVTLFAGLQTLALGIIGEYIRKIYLEVLHRPRGFIRDLVGFD